MENLRAVPIVIDDDTVYNNRECLRREVEPDGMMKLLHYICYHETMLDELGGDCDFFIPQPNTCVAHIKDHKTYCLLKKKSNSEELKIIVFDATRSVVRNPLGLRFESNSLGLKYDNFVQMLYSYQEYERDEYLPFFCARIMIELSKAGIQSLDNLDTEALQLFVDFVVQNDIVSDIFYFFGFIHGAFPDPTELPEYFDELENAFYKHMTSLVDIHYCPFCLQRKRNNDQISSEPEPEPSPASASASASTSTSTSTSASTSVSECTDNMQCVDEDCNEHEREKDFVPKKRAKN